MIRLPGLRAPLNRGHFRAGIDLVMGRRKLRLENAPMVIPDDVVSSALDSKLFHMIDAVWCDTHGVFVRGWAHAHDIPILSIHLSSGNSRTQVTDFHDRPDLRHVFPSLTSTNSGFSAYLACSPFRPVTLEINTAQGPVQIDVTELPPDHPSNVRPPDPAVPLPKFAEEMKRVSGTVIEVGARAVSPGAVLHAGMFAPECKFIGVDIHEAPGVDVVADAHFLSEHFAAGSIDGLFSMAVMEHLTCPWVFAGQINKLLKPGGLTLHTVPQSFPIHETPNDFWRVAKEGLEVLFSPEMGFEVIEADMLMPLKMHIHPSLRSGSMLEFQLVDGMAMSYVLARKTFDLPDGAVSWPLKRDRSAIQGKNYPKH